MYTAPVCQLGATLHGRCCLFAIEPLTSVTPLSLDASAGEHCKPTTTTTPLCL